MCRKWQLILRQSYVVQVSSGEWCRASEYSTDMMLWEEHSEWTSSLMIGLWTGWKHFGVITPLAVFSK